MKGKKSHLESKTTKVDQGFSVLDATLDCARAGFAAEMLGAAAESFDMTLNYLKTRVQPGQLIGAFQALGHRAATLYTEMEMTRSCVEAALQGRRVSASRVERAHPNAQRHRHGRRIAWRAGSCKSASVGC